MYFFFQTGVRIPDSRSACGPRGFEKRTDRLLVEESIIKREGEFTLNLAADVENFTALPAGYEIARQAEKRWVVQARAPYILFPNAGVATGQRAGLLLRAAALRLPQPA